MNGFSDLTGLEKVFQILTTIGGRPGALGELKDAETTRKLRRLQLEDLMRTREEGERPASLPLFTQKEIPTGGIGTTERGEIPQYDVPTGIRKELGVEQIPIPGYKMRDIGKVDLGDLYKSFTGQKKSYAINKEGQTMVYSPGDPLPPGYTPIEHQFKEEKENIKFSRDVQMEDGTLWTINVYDKGRTEWKPAMVPEPVIQPGMEPTPLPITPETKFQSKEEAAISGKKPTLKQLKGKRTPKLPLHRDYADEKTGITWRQEYEDDGTTKKGVPYKVRVPAPEKPQDVYRQNVKDKGSAYARISAIEQARATLLSKGVDDTVLDAIVYPEMKAMVQRWVGRKMSPEDLKQVFDAFDDEIAFLKKTYLGGEGKGLGGKGEGGVGLDVVKKAIESVAGAPTPGVQPVKKKGYVLKDKTGRTFVRFEDGSEIEVDVKEGKIIPKGK